MHQKLKRVLLIAGTFVMVINVKLVRAESLVILNERGNPGRDVLELVGDGKTEDFGRPVVDQDSSDAIVSYLTEGPEDGQVARYVEFTGDNCGPNTCFALIFYKSYHGVLDLKKYKKLVFDMKVEKAPDPFLGVRIGSYPSRAEIDITARVPKPGDGWKTVKIALDEFEQNTFEGYTPDYTEDVLSLGTTGTAIFSIANARWEG